MFDSVFDSVPEVLTGLRPRFARYVGRPMPAIEHRIARTIRSDDRTRRAIAAAYEALPASSDDEDTLQAFAALRDEVRTQFDFLVDCLGVDVSVSDEDPYPSASDLVADLREGRLRVFATAATGGHPFLSDDDNDRFRAVHDAFGHAPIGCGFDRHGEEAAWALHSAMFTRLARRALATETRGQSAAMIESDEPGFVEQKVGLLPPLFASLATLRTNCDQWS